MVESEPIDPDFDSDFDPDETNSQQDVGPDAGNASE